MSTPIKDGGPAYPAAPNPNYTDDANLGQRGMTLRDYFAGQALAGLFSMRGQFGQHLSGDMKEAAGFAYAQADAMIAARETQP